MTKENASDGSSDYVIVGAGSAGCVLANRLSENGRHTVTLVEAGGSDRRFWVKVPIGYGKTFFDQRVNWKYTTSENESLNGRSSYWPRGKVLGGSSSINAMVYIRGAKRDFNDWADRGNPGWDYQSVLPYFVRSVDSDFPEGDFHQTGGPLKVTDTTQQVHPLCNTWLEGARQAGFDISDDFNGADMEGAGIYAITTRKGIRSSAASAYLDPARRRNNLRIVTNAHVRKVRFDTRRATGIEYVCGDNGPVKNLNANREVILCAGAVNTPQLLELSGIGAADVLERNDISPVYVNPNVGEHLQDHIGINYNYRSRVPTLNDSLSPWHGKLREGIKYLLTRQGHLSLSVNQAGGFVRTDEQQPGPNLQLYFSPISYTTAPSGTRPLMHPDSWPGFIMSFQPCRPSSRGSIHLDSADYRDAPVIKPNYLGTQEDIADVIAGGHLLRKLAATPALSAVIESETEPGLASNTDEDLVEDFRNRADTVFHPCGTCAMGPDMKNSVVNSQLQIHGVDGLRVVDASIFPNITSGNTNAPVIMVAEKAADVILRK